MCSVFVFSLLAAGPSEVSAYTQFLKTKQLVIDFIKNITMSGIVCYTERNFYFAISLFYLSTLSLFFTFLFQAGQSVSNANKTGGLGG